MKYPRPNMSLPVFSSKNIVWTKEYGIAESSELFHTQSPRRVWNDSYDVGFNVFSEKTGCIVTFVLYRKEKNADGETTVEIYKTLDGKHEIHVLND